MTESASHRVYRQTLEGIAAIQGIAVNSIADLLESDQVMFGELIHHREAPQSVANADADVAIVYDHLARRYCRVFPELFDRIPLPDDECNVTTRYKIGLVDESCQVACDAYDFFLSETAASIYRHHGLVPAFEV